MQTKRKIWTYFFIVLIFLACLVGLIVVLAYANNDVKVNIILAFTIAAILIAMIIVLFKATSQFARSRELVKKSFNSLLEEIMSNNSIGMLIYDVNRQIIWTSNFFTNTLKEDFIGQDIMDFFNKYDKNYDLNSLLNNNKSTLNIEGSSYEVQFWPKSNTVILRDITAENSFKVLAKNQQPVIGEIEIDNFQLYQSILSDEQLFNINQVVIDVIKQYVEKYNLIYRQYTNGKFVIFTNEETLKKLQDTQFNLFMQVHENISDPSISKLTLSIGFARGWSSLKDKLEQAKKALVQAQSRGGDQVAIFSNASAPVYFGSNSEILADNNQAKIRLVAENFEKALRNDKIDSVVIYAHKWADLDAIGSAYAVYEIARAFGKKAYIAISSYDSTGKNQQKVLIEKSIYKNDDIFLKKAEKGSELTNEKTMVVLVDTSDPRRTDNENALVNAARENIFIFDHHRYAFPIDFCPKTNRYIETSSSSASEIVTEVLTYLDHKVNLTEPAAQMLLNGIYLDTSQFTKSVTPRTFKAAGWLEAKGAKSNISSEVLKIDQNTQDLVNEILENTTEVKKGYFLAYSELETTNDIISIAANQLLNIRGRIASFVVAKLKDEGLYKLSARGIETNVQIICEAVGGGGHFSTAAANSNEDLETFVDNIKQAIISARKEEYNENNLD
ncbi:DHH family phosphoesterase [Mycoplasma corogypsi]|uniref:DHH family phosphoesterase n=1 Tax=Mycoplasma corogypsi TaxID=2106 RepID=UPI003872D895